jgi:hypothetical protein
VATWLIAESYLRFPSRLWIVFGIAGNLAVLAFFKYLAFAAGAVVGVLGVPVQGWSIILPLGISFYTFELISYLVDLRRGGRPALSVAAVLSVHLPLPASRRRPDHQAQRDHPAIQPLAVPAGPRHGRSPDMP